MLQWKCLQKQVICQICRGGFVVAQVLRTAPGSLASMSKLKRAPWPLQCLLLWPHSHAQLLGYFQRFTCHRDAQHCNRNQEPGPARHLELHVIGLGSVHSAEVSILRSLLQD